MAILKDLDKKIYAINPAIKHAIAVRVPDGKTAQKLINPVAKKKYLYFFILEVIPKIVNATAVEAAPIP